MNAVLGNNPSLKSVAVQVKVNRKEGWTLGADGLRLLLSILRAATSRTPARKLAMEDFLEWGGAVLLPAVEASARGAIPEVPKRVSIDLEDPRCLRIEVEMTNGRKVTFRT
jgi:hypothetical protein